MVMITPQWSLSLKIFMKSYPKIIQQKSYPAIIKLMIKAFGETIICLGRAGMDQVSRFFILQPGSLVSYHLVVGDTLLLRKCKK